MKLYMGLLRSDSEIKKTCNVAVRVNALNDIVDGNRRTSHIPRHCQRAKKHWMLDDSNSVGSDEVASGADKRKVKVKVKCQVAPLVGIVTTVLITGPVLPRGRVLSP